MNSPSKSPSIPAITSFITIALIAGEGVTGCAWGGGSAGGVTGGGGVSVMTVEVGTEAGGAGISDCGVADAGVLVIVIVEFSLRGVPSGAALVCHPAPF